MEERLKVQAKKEAAMLAEINKVIDVLKSAPVKLTAKTGTSGKIFGTITSLQIARAIRDQKGYEIDRKRIAIVDDVKDYIKRCKKCQQHGKIVKKISPELQSIPI